MSVIYPSKVREEANRFVVEHVRNWSKLHIFEVGMIRGPSAESDGHSTLFWRSLIEGRRDKILTSMEATLTSIDVDFKALEVTKEILGRNNFSFENTKLIYGDALKFLRDFSANWVNLVYLDGLDYVDKEASEDFHRVCFSQMEGQLPVGALVVVDDNLNQKTFEGKGRLICEGAPRMGYKIIHNSYQVVLEKL